MELGKASFLSQVRPSNANASVGYDASVQTEVTLINVCNLTTTDQRFSIYHDDDGATFDDTTALYRNELVPAQGTVPVELFAAGGGISVSAGGNIGVQSSAANSINFTLYGITTDITGGNNG